MHHSEMYAHHAVAGRPRIPMPRGANDKPIPTAMPFMETRSLAQGAVIGCSNNGHAQLLPEQRPVAAAELTAEVLQTLLLDTTGDMLLRFKHKTAPRMQNALIFGKAKDSGKSTIMRIFSDIFGGKFFDITVYKFANMN